VSKKPAEGTPALREMLLSAKPSEFKIAPTPELPRVCAAMMEMRVGKADVSLVAVADGTTSMYFSTGGGFIGAANTSPCAGPTAKCSSSSSGCSPRSSRERRRSGRRGCGLIRGADA
jgi:hypothetical protein